MVDAASGPLWIAVQATGNIRFYQIIMSLLIVSNIPIMLLLIYFGISPIWVVSVRAIINFITHLVRIAYLKINIGFSVKRYLCDVMCRIILITILSLPLAIYLKEFSNTMIGAALVFFTIMLQNIILVVIFGVTKSERIMGLNLIKSKFRTRSLDRGNTEGNLL